MDHPQAESRVSPWARPPAGKGGASQAAERGRDIRQKSGGTRRRTASWQPRACAWPLEPLVLSAGWPRPFVRGGRGRVAYTIASAEQAVSICSDLHFVKLASSPAGAFLPPPRGAMSAAVPLPPAPGSPVTLRLCIVRGSGVCSVPSRRRREFWTDMAKGAFRHNKHRRRVSAERSCDLARESRVDE